MSMFTSLFENPGKYANKAAQASQVNLDQLSALVQKTSQENAMLSRELQNKLDPWVNPLQTQSAAGMMGAMGATPGENAATQALMNRLRGSTPLGAAAQEAQKQLALGGTVPQDVQNATLRAAAARSGAVGGGGLGLGRDIGARDLGLSSLALLQQRMQNAASIGQAQDQSIQSAAGGLATLANSQFQRPYAAAGLGMQYQAPKVGLDPSAMANVSLANASNLSKAYMNQAQLLGQQQGQALNFIGQMAGSAMGMPSFGGGAGASSFAAPNMGSGMGLGQVYNPGVGNMSAFAFPGR